MPFFPFDSQNTCRQQTNAGNHLKIYHPKDADEYQIDGYDIVQRPGDQKNQQAAENRHDRSVESKNSSFLLNHV
jgi:hypothetical protein